jgi:hypothetical protein
MLQEIYSEQSRVRNIGIDAVRQSSCIFIRLNSTCIGAKNAVLRHVCTIDCDAVDVDRLADQVDMCSMRTLLVGLAGLVSWLGRTRRHQTSSRAAMPTTQSIHPAARLSPATLPSTSDNLATPSGGCSGHLPSLAPRIVHAVPLASTALCDARRHC